MVSPSKTTRLSRVKRLEIATGELNQTMPCRIRFSECGEGAGFVVSIPHHLIEAEDQKVWDAFEERCGGGG